MGWVTRRIAGFITFAVVSGILGFIAVTGGYLSGPPTLSTTRGIVILAIAFLCSLGVTASMKRKDRERKAYEENATAWQAYYAQVDAAWRDYYARMNAQSASRLEPAPPARRP